jgi:hypothetical protein
MESKSELIKRYEQELKQKEENYFTGRIYKITNSNTERFYIGSTSKTLEERLKKHKSHFHEYLKGNHHKMASFELLKDGIPKISLICEYKCVTKKLLHLLEGVYIRKYKKHCVNIQIPGRTRKEYCKDNSDKIKAIHKKYRLNHPDKVKFNNEKFYQTNKEILKEYSRQYRENNKAEIAKKRAVQIHCACGLTYCKLHKSRHMKSKKHIEGLNKL